MDEVIAEENVTEESIVTQISVKRKKFGSKSGTAAKREKKLSPELEEYIELGEKFSVREQKLEEYIDHDRWLLEFLFRELQTASSDFSSDMEIGREAYAIVYKGHLSTKEISIRRFTTDEKQKHFFAEMHALSMLRHRNIERCIGWCHKGDEFLIVHEYMQNGTLYDRLLNFDVLPWDVRFKASLDLASAILYMHEDSGCCILHRNIKSRNVLFDYSNNVNLTGFALAYVGDHYHEDESYSAAMRANVCLDPEYVKTGVFTRGSDVYSFGVVILQLATGQVAVDEYTMVNKVRDTYMRGPILDVADERLDNAFDKEQMERLLTVGFLCTDPRSLRRPPLDEVLRFLKFGIRMSYVEVMETLPEINQEGWATCHHTIGSFSAFTSKPEDTAMMNFDTVKTCLMIWIGLNNFSYMDLLTATDEFSPKMIVDGYGSYGTTYKGNLSGVNVFIKRLNSEEKYYYLSEMNALEALRHKNIVRCIGSCHNNENLILVHEFMDNGTLSYHLHSSMDVLPWYARFRISLDIASAILYMHEQSYDCILHRDINSKNILLDTNYNVKLASFNVARPMELEEESLYSVVCSSGYLDPECLTTRVFTPATDVYCFGIVILEIATGQVALNEHRYIVDMVKDSQKRGRIMEVSDERLNGAFNEIEMERLLTAGLCCTERYPEQRPSLVEVIQFLNFGDPMLPMEQLPIQDSPINKHVQEKIWVEGELIKATESTDTSIPSNNNSSVLASATEFLKIGIPAHHNSSELTSAQESIDIGIPADYNSTEPMSDSHRRVIHGFLATLSKNIESGARFKEVMEIIRKFTSTIVLLGAPLSGWNSIAQSLLRDLQTLENLEDEDQLVSNQKGRTVGSIQMKLKERLLAIEENDAELGKFTLELDSIKQEHVSSMNRFRGLQQKLVELQQRINCIEETWDLGEDKMELLNQWRTENIERMEYAESAILTLHESLLFKTSTFTFDD